MNYPHIISKVYGQPWLITRDKHQAIQRILQARINGERARMEMGEEDCEEPIGEPVLINRTLKIPVSGILGKKLSMMEMLCGGYDVDRLTAAIEYGNNNPLVDKMVIEFDSPGGTVTGIPEAGRAIKNSKKPIYATTETLCCSAAYWLASQAQEFYATQSSIVGSVGVYAVFFDESAAYETDGIKVTQLQGGQFKTAGSPYKPMSEEEKAYLQTGIDKIYKDFKESVLSQRQIPEEYLQGQVFYGDEAASLGFCAMADDMDFLF